MAKDSSARSGFELAKRSSFVSTRRHSLGSNGHLVSSGSLDSVHLRLLCGQRALDARTFACATWRHLNSVASSTMRRPRTSSHSWDPWLGVRKTG
jgi:hypothetical protein